MTLRQAIGVIIGANIGTTATAFIIGIDIAEYALPIVAAGTFLIFFVHNQRVKNFGRVIFGFGSLFLGLNLMSEGLYPLREAQAFQELTVSMSENPLLGVLIGTIFTVAVQSSSAAIGLLQTLFAQGSMTLDAALPVLFGDNIGTTITAVLAAIGASVTAKRAALTHVIFNVVGTILVLLLLVPFTALIEYLQASLELNPQMTIAFAHGIFNISNAIIQLPFIAVLAWIVVKVIPGNEQLIEHKPLHLNEQMIESSPSVALGLGKKEVLRMADLTVEGLQEAIQYVKTGNRKHGERIPQFESAINNLDQEISEYLTKISAQSLTVQDSKLHNVLLNTSRDLERIGDHMENIMELADYQRNNKISFSESATSDIDEMFDLTFSALKQAVKALDTNDVTETKAVADKENDIDKMEQVLRKRHIQRVINKECTGVAGIVYIDIVSNLERVGDHAVNIAETVLDID